MGALNTLTAVVKTRLVGMDKRFRSGVRRILHLLYDVPNVALHALVKTGGLGITQLIHVVPYTEGIALPKR